REARRGGVITATGRWAPPLMFQVRRLRIGRSVNGGVNYFHDAVDVADDLVIPEADHAVALRFEPPSARLVAFCVFTLVMLPAVHLDQQLRSHAGKVCYVGANRNLTAEVTSEHRHLAEMTPEF